MFQTTNQCDIYAINSPARRDSWGAEPIDSNNPPFSGAASAGRGPHLQDRTRAKQKVPRCRNLHSSATSSTSFTVFDPTCPQHGLNLGPALANKAPTWAQLGPNLDPFGPVWEQQVGDYRPNLKSWKTRAFSGVSHVYVLWHRWRFVLTTIPHVVPPLGPTWCEAIAKGPPKLHYAEHDLDLHVHHMASSSAHLDQTLGPTSAQHNSNLGSSWVQHSATWAQALFADSMRHAENVRFDCYFQRFLASVGVRAMPCSPHWACLGPSFGGSCPLAGPSCAG